MAESAETIDLSGQVVIVTGGGRGLGRAYALALAARGALVVVNDLGTGVDGKGQEQTAADQVVEEIRQAGGVAIANYASVATRAGGAAIVAAALQAFGRLDALVNNAGLLTDAPFAEQSDQQITAMLDVHLKGAFHVTQPAFESMQKAGYGRIVFTGSSSGMFGHPWHASYGAAKAGLLGLLNVVALEGAPYGILANLVMPSAVTRLMGSMASGLTENRAFAAAKARADVEALLFAMRPEFAAPLVTYLASSACHETQCLYSQVGNRYARAFVGVAQGWQAAGSAPPTAEDIARHWHEISDLGTYHVPRNNYDEIAVVSPARP